MPVQAFHDVAALRAATHDQFIIRDDGVEVKDATAIREHTIDQLVWTAVFGERGVMEASRWLIRHLAPALGAWPASINDLYMAAGRDAYSNVTTPAINLRGMTYDLARTVFRAGQATDARQVILELARSEMGYTRQRPAEYASAVLAAAIKEGWQGPVFIQGDHYQASQKAYFSDPETEIAAVRDLAIEAIAAGYGNVDIDASTLVDLSHETLAEQQAANYRHTAELTRAIRENEPEGVTISIGGEIGEVGKANSTVEDLDAFMTGYLDELGRLSDETDTDLTGISKISVQTGTSHGGVVLPDGSIQEVSVDFETLARLSDVARHRYGMGGAVQHGASTLPEEAFDRFAAANAVEVHLATAFQNVIYDSDAFPAGLRDEIYAHLAANHADERRPDQTDEQFYYTTRKRGFGPFKHQLWSLPESTKAEILAEVQPRFELIMRELRVAGQGHLVDEHIRQVDVRTQAPASLLAVR